MYRTAQLVVSGLDHANPMTMMMRMPVYFQALAESASLSLEASYLFAQTEHRARQLETSAEVGQTIGQILDLRCLAATGG